MAYPVMDIANYFIWRVNSDTESGDNITNLKLQKLVYYAQGFHLAIVGEPLFDEPIEAWTHGPVVRHLYNLHQKNGARPIETPEGFDVESLDSQTLALLDEVFEVYGQYSAWGLRNLTHDERPWKETKNLEVIPNALMKEYFAETVARAR